MNDRPQSTDASDSTGEATSLPEWYDSPEGVAIRYRYFPIAYFGAFLAFAGIVAFPAAQSIAGIIGVTKRAEYLIAGSVILLGVILASVAFNRMYSARASFYAAQTQSALQAVNKALDDITGPDDLMGLMRANRKQMDAYDALARSQAQTSYRSSQIAMGIGLLILGAGIVIVVLAHSDATKYAAAIVTACGSAVGGYVSRTFINVHLHASDQMNFYFRQPLVQSYLLSAERLAQRLPEQAKAEQIGKILAVAMAQVDPSQTTHAPSPARSRRRILRAASTPPSTEAADSG